MNIISFEEKTGIFKHKLIKESTNVCRFDYIKIDF